MTETPRTLRDLAETFGLSESEIAQAEADGTLPLLVLDRVVLPEPGKYTEEDVAEMTGLGDQARRLWRALGMPNPEPGDRAFNDVDIEMLRIADQLISLDLVDTDVLFQFARVIGSSISRIAETQVEAVAARQPDAADTTERMLTRAGLMLNVMPRILEYTWRRHLQVAARRRVLAGLGPDERGVTVGFADLVGFTALSQQLEDHELSKVVDRFEHTAYDVVGDAGGRIVKMIGDEVMFAVDDPVTAVDIALRLSDAYHGDEDISDVRVGLASGPVLQREGDLFGPTVNLASRIVSIAYPSSVVVSDEVHTAAAGQPDLVWKPLRTRYLKGIGRVQLWHVRHVDEDSSERAVDRARRRRNRIRDRIAELAEGE